MKNLMKAWLISRLVASVAAALSSVSARAGTAKAAIPAIRTRPELNCAICMAIFLDLLRYAIFSPDPLAARNVFLVLSCFGDDRRIPASGAGACHFVGAETLSTGPPLSAHSLK